MDTQETTAGRLEIEGLPARAKDRVQSQPGYLSKAVLKNRVKFEGGGL